MYVKICGVTTVFDALGCADAGADAIGVNFWPGSVRRCEPRVAAEIARAVGARVRVVGVFVDAALDEIERVRAATGVEWAQLHGDEPIEALAALLPHAFKAIRADGPGAVARARAYGGELLLVDASVAGAPGGTGRATDPDVAAAIARERRVLLAGGLTPANVAATIARVRPWGVDVASGVESAPGVKDLAKVRAFVAAARGAPLLT